MTPTSDDRPARAPTADPEAETTAASDATRDGGDRPPSSRPQRSSGPKRSSGRPSTRTRRGGARRPSGDESAKSEKPTRVASESSAPAPPRRGRQRPDDSAVAGGAAAAAAALVPSASSGPTAAASPLPAEPETEGEAVLVDESAERGVETRPSRRIRRAPRATTREEPEPIQALAPVPAARPALGAVTERRFRQTITKVDLWSVTKLALCFYISAMFVTIVAMVALWLVADAAGIISNVEDFVGDLLSSNDFHFLSGEVLRGVILIGLVGVALQVVITVIFASFYNVFAELFGGLEITVKEEEGQSR